MMAKATFTFSIMHSFDTKVHSCKLFAHRMPNRSKSSQRFGWGWINGFFSVKKYIFNIPNLYPRDINWAHNIKFLDLETGRVTICRTWTKGLRSCKYKPSLFRFEYWQKYKTNSQKCLFILKIFKRHAKNLSVYSL